MVLGAHDLWTVTRSSRLETEVLHCRVQLIGVATGIVPGVNGIEPGSLEVGSVHAERLLLFLQMCKRISSPVSKQGVEGY